MGLLIIDQKPEMDLAAITLQRVPGEAQLADDVAGDVGFDALTLLGMTFCCLQQVVELLWVKLLQGMMGNDTASGFSLISN